MVEQLTFISAIIDLGRKSWNSFGNIQPPDGHNPNPYTYSKENYLLWFSYYLNFSVPMIIFVDEPYYEDVECICRHAQHIKLIKIDKEWILKNIDGWKYFEGVKTIMESDKFKKLIGHRTQFPNVSVPQYVTNTYTKLDYVEYAIKNKMFDTPYVAWTDFGIFKDRGYYLENFKINMISIFFLLLIVFTLAPYKKWIIFKLLLMWPFLRVLMIWRIIKKVFALNFVRKRRLFTLFAPKTNIQNKNGLKFFHL
jgi:hypothetical protein